jgi:hypothetical protein
MFCVAAPVVSDRVANGHRGVRLSLDAHAFDVLPDLAVPADGLHASSLRSLDLTRPAPEAAFDDALTLLSPLLFFECAITVEGIKGFKLALHAIHARRKRGIRRSGLRALC